MPGASRWIIMELNVAWHKRNMPNEHAETIAPRLSPGKQNAGRDGRVRCLQKLRTMWRPRPELSRGSRICSAAEPVGYYDRGARGLNTNSMLREHGA